MKKIFSICVLGLGLAVLVSGAAAQQSFVKGGVAGVRGLHTRAVLPPHDIFSNCGTGCSSYNTASGYYVAGTGSEGAGQTLAVGFTPTQTVTFRFALTPNTNYTGVSGAGVSAFLLNGTATGGPTSQLAALTQGGTIPDYPTLRVVRYHGRVKLVKGTTYFLCETEPNSTAVMLWMLSNDDFTSPFWFQDGGACTGSLTWLNATGATAPAFKIRAL